MRLIPLLAPLALAACSPPPPDNAAAGNDSGANSALAEPAAPSPAPSPANESVGNSAAPSDDSTPPDEAGFAATSAQGAADVVQHYYALIAEGAFERAWRLWEDGGRASGKTAAEFAADFGKYADYHAEVGAPGEIDAGAGQRYVTVPVRLYGRLKEGGAPFETRATVTLHRAGDVDGATLEQRRWHIRSIE
ncbi:MAG: hypothetical protein WDN24_07725 [Sphingomonas sp.]